MKQGKIKSLIDTGQEVGDKLKYNVSTYEGDNGIIWISKNPLWQCKVGDVIQYQHKRDTTTYKDSPKFVNWKKLKKVEQPMHGNYKPNNNYEKKPVNEYEARLDTGRSILLQVAFKEASQAYIAGKITQDEVATLTNNYFKIIDK